ncbi:hypothetical protein VTJ83DRAFT_1046 [Remersonia thermophila]|uniref:Uncharacterized protein n=1 Tax=Remersonia thermophila TaxID=72144 RepID=A0ABR4DN02_9PEZI
MSADLFAAFGDLSETAPPQPNDHQGKLGQGALNNNNNPVATSATQDLFSLIAPSAPAPQQPTGQQPSFWTQSQPATAQPSLFTASPATQPPKTDDPWGQLSSLGSQGGIQSQPPSSFPPLHQQSAQADDDDGWGDFVDPTEAAPPPPPTATATATTTTAAPLRSRVTRASTIDMMTNKLVDLGLDTSTPEPWQQRPSWEKDSKPEKPKKPVHNPDPNVLFDADFEAENELDEDDEFGDFETGTPVTSVSPAAPATSALDLLSLASTTVPPKKQPPGLNLANAAFNASPASYPEAPKSPYPEAPKSPYGSFHDRKPEQIKQLQVKPPAAKIPKDPHEASPSPVTAWPTVEAEGFGSNWEEFKDLPGTKPAASQRASKPQAKPALTSALPSSDWDWKDWTAEENPSTTATASSAAPEDKPGPPPTNIPPPAILLSLFPQLLDLASASLLKPLLTLAPSSPAYQRVVGAEATLNFLRGYLSLATVAAHIITGRKHRWHRDRFLSQNMSISAAPAGGGQRGMKLASIDRSHSAHDDREAAEVAAVWKRNVGRLRSVVAAVNAAHQASGTATLRVPEVAVGLAVSTAKGVPTAPKACVVCGLKREERVVKVDVGVEDSFGEWWVEFWGHRECRNFWLQHEKELRSR